jgi:hypothetical protein
MLNYSGIFSKESLFANIILGSKGQTVTNTQPYYSMELISAIKVIVKALINKQSLSKSRVADIHKTCHKRFIIILSKLRLSS